MRERAGSTWVRIQEATIGGLSEFLLLAILQVILHVFVYIKVDIKAVMFLFTVILNNLIPIILAVIVVTNKVVFITKHYFDMVMINLNSIQCASRVISFQFDSFLEVSFLFVKILFVFTLNLQVLSFVAMVSYIQII